MIMKYILRLWVLVAAGLLCLVQVSSSPTLTSRSPGSLSDRLILDRKTGKDWHLANWAVELGVRMNIKDTMGECKNMAEVKKVMTSIPQ